MALCFAAGRVDGRPFSTMGYTVVARVLYSPCQQPNDKNAYRLVEHTSRRLEHRQISGTNSMPQDPLVGQQRWNRPRHPSTTRGLG